MSFPVVRQLISTLGPLTEDQWKDIGANLTSGTGFALLGLAKV